MQSILSPIQSDVRTALTTYIENSELPWTVKSRLVDYASRGKLIRGSLVAFAQSLFKDSYDEAAIDVGVSMELLQTFLLIHDDIMDNDDWRRGGLSIHRQYQDEAPQESHGYRFGISQAISVGDISAFLAVRRVSTIRAPEKVRLQLQELISREIILVGLAQMDDVRLGFSKDASLTEVLDLYTQKTGRYTFSLPLMTGAILAKAPEKDIVTLGSLGEHLGRVFQIRDDELGIFGNQQETGKPVGSDIVEDKKTIFRTLLFQKSDQTERLSRIFGSTGLAEQDLRFIRNELHHTGVYNEVEELIERESISSREAIASLQVQKDGKDSLLALLDYNNNRKV